MPHCPPGLMITVFVLGFAQQLLGACVIQRRALRCLSLELKCRALEGKESVNRRSIATLEERFLRTEAANVVPHKSD